MESRANPEQRAKRIARLREIVDVVTGRSAAWEGRLWWHAIASEMTMRIPAEPDRDADLVLSWAAAELERRADLPWLPEELFSDVLDAYHRATESELKYVVERVIAACDRGKGEE
jgi:hypothetical protein